MGMHGIHAAPTEDRHRLQQLCQCTRTPDNKGYLQTVTLELEFPDREPLWTLHGVYLTDYELDPFLESGERAYGDFSGDRFDILWHVEGLRARRPMHVAVECRWPDDLWKAARCAVLRANCEWSVSQQRDSMVPCGALSHHGTVDARRSSATLLERHRRPCLLPSMGKGDRLRGADAFGKPLSATSFDMSRRATAPMSRVTVYRVDLVPG